MDTLHANCAFLFSEGDMPSSSREDEACVYLAVKLSPEAIEASDLLKGFAGAKGHATLPSGVSDEDVLLWRSSSPNQDERPLQELVRIIQVAEALSDTRLEQWAELLATQAANTSWQSISSSEDMHEVLLSLSPNVRTAVLQHVLSLMTPPAALTTLPPTLHPHLISAMVDSSGCLSLESNSPAAVASFMAMLPSLHLSAAPPLRLLDCSHAEVQPSSCHLLADALRHSSALSHLALGLPEAPAHSARALRILLPPLAQVSALRVLQLCSPGHNTTIFMQALDALTSALSTLQHLDTLLIDDTDVSDSADGAPRATAGAPRMHVASGSTAAQQRPMARFLAAVAEHPCLTTLHLECVGMYAALPWPPEFPVLRRLDVACWAVVPGGSVSRSKPPPRVVPVRFPDLTHLRFAFSAERGTATQAQVTNAVPAFGLPGWLPIGGNRGQGLCPALRSLCIDVSRFELPIGAHTERFIWRTLAGAISAAPSVQDLCLETLSLPTAAAMATGHLLQLSLLTSLQLTGEYASTDGAMPPDFPRSLPLTLRSLCLGAHDDATGAIAREMLARLHRASELTSLHLQWNCPGRDETPALCGAVHGEALPLLASLRSVRLDWCLVAQAEELWRGLSRLPLLRCLHLNSVTVQVANSARLTPLSEVLLASCGAFAEAVTAMPSLQHLYLDAGLPLLRVLGRDLAARRRPSQAPLELAHLFGRPCNGGPDSLAALADELEPQNIRLVHVHEAGRFEGIVVE